MPKAKKTAKQPRNPKLPPGLHAIDRLQRVIASRKGADPHTSYTARLLSRGPNKIAQKLGEEAVETAIEAVRRDRKLLVLESADLLYHLLALWTALDVEPKSVWRELRKREGRSGIEEKKSRKSRAK
jgi:phosphoribosyl-ATP pyrophosphohydrolase